MKLSNLCNNLKFNIDKFLLIEKVKELIEHNTNIKDSITHSRVLWRVAGPEKTEFIVTSAIQVIYSGIKETFCFEAFSNGSIKNYSDLPGSFSGDIDHERAILGYLEHLYK